MDALDYFIKYATPLGYEMHQLESGRFYSGKTFFDGYTEQLWRGYRAGFEQALEALNEQKED